MKLLAVDTATSWQSLALLDGEEVIARTERDAGGSHGKWIVAAVDELLRAAELELRAVDAFCVSLGPGSFTGLRIGIATMLGFRAVTGRPLAAVPTLEALAWNVREPGPAVCPVIKARSGEAYWALYRWIGEELVELLAPRVGPVDAIPETLSEPTLLLGDGWLAHRDRLRAGSADRAGWLRDARPEAMRPSAVSVGRAGLRRLGRGEVQPVGVAPLYVQRSEAELNWERARAGTNGPSRDAPLGGTVVTG